MAEDRGDGGRGGGTARIVAWHEASRSFIMSGMAPARAWLNDPDQWRDPDRAEPGALAHSFKPADMNRPGDRDSSIGFMDEPDHSRVRAPIQSALARRVAGMAPTIEAIVAQRLEALPAGRLDVLIDFAEPIPIAVIGALLGVDTSDLDRFRALSKAALRVFDPAPDAPSRSAVKAASEAMSEDLDQAMARRRDRPSDDLISDLLAAQAQGAAISDSEIRVNCMNLLLGGAVTTADLIANGVDLLLRHPDQLALLRREPQRIGAAVEEILRCAPPTLGTQRIASRDLEVAGCPVKAGQVVAVMIALANRDPAAVSQPERFDIQRRDGAHLSFGGGPHICIGAHLARLEAKLAVQALIRRYPDLALAQPDEPPLWRATPFFQGLAELKVVTGRALHAPG
jgi:cytochrome P450